MEVLRKDAEAELVLNPKYRGRFLFPWNDRISGATYRFRGREYRLVPNEDDGSAIHGFLYKSPATVERVRAQSNLASVTLSYETAGDPGYPFQCRLTIRMELRSDSLCLSFKVRNIGRDCAPVGLGWHPYFNLGCPVDDVLLQADGALFFPADEALIPKGYLSPVERTEYDFRTPRKIGGQSLDIAIQSGQNGRIMVSGVLGRLSILFDTGLFRCVQLYIPPERDSIAVEPVTSAADAFNRDESGITVLEPGETRTGWIQVWFEASKPN